MTLQLILGVPPGCGQQVFELIRSVALLPGLSGDTCGITEWGACVPDSPLILEERSESARTASSDSHLFESSSTFGL